jgi:predicted dehydrogenase
LHVLLEKPMTIEPREAYALVELAQVNGRELIIGYPWHYNRQVVALRGAIASGQIGRIEAVACLFASVVRELYRGHPERYRDVLGYPLNAPSVPTYADTSASGGGQGQWQVTHAAALLQWLTDLEPAEVSAFTADHGLTMDLVDAVSIRFAGGAIGTITSTGGVTARQDEMLEYRIFGTEGHIVLDVNGGTAAIHRSDGSVESLVELPAASRYPEWAPVDDLVAVAMGTGVNGSPALLGARTVGLVEAMYRSAAVGSSVTVFQP